MDTQPMKKPVYNAHVEWPPLDEERPDKERQDEEPEVPGKSHLVEVSEETRCFLVDKCTCGIANEVRRRTWSRFPLPKVAATKTPQLDPLMKTEASAGAKAGDKELAKIQFFVLDTLAPLTFVIEKHNKQEAPSPNDFLQASLAAAEAPRKCQRENFLSQ